MVTLIFVTLVCLISDDLYFRIVVCGWCEALGRCRTVDLALRLGNFGQPIHCLNSVEL